MPVTGSTLRVEGLSDLTRAFRIVDKELAGDLRDGLKRVAEPVARDAERLTVARINRGRIPWWQMRVGATQTGAYIVPKQRSKAPPQRRRKSYRTTVLPLMLGAARANESRVRREAEAVVNRAIDKWGRAG